MTVPDARTSEAFVRLHLTGGRFERDNGLPVEAMAELVTYQELLHAVARHLFFVQHPDRRRVPHGFRERLALRLTRVDNGSVVPVLERPFADQLNMADEFTAARDMVETAIDRAAIEGDVALPRDVFHTFARFGQTLRDDERIMLIRAGRSAGPSYDSDLRRRLLLRREHRYTRSETIVASVIDLNTESRTFRTRLEDGTALSGDYNSEEFELLKRALQPELPLVELDCIVSYDAEERPLRIVSVRDLRMDDAIADTALVDVAPALSLRLQTRLDELRNLGSGWLDGTGRAITPAAQDALRQLLLAVARTPEPRLYPTDDGGVRAEWTVGDTDLSVEVASDGSFYSHALDLSSDHDDEDETAAVDEAVAFIARWLP